jgi:hypothetical protein
MLSSSFTKQLAIADINLTSAFLEEAKHHWGSLSMPEMLQEKLHHVAVSNVNAKVKVGWLKLWNGNRFDKDALHFPKSPLSDSALNDWVSKSTYWAQLEKKTIEELLSKNFKIFFHLLFSCLQMCLLSPSISKPGSLWLSIQYSIVISKAEKSKNTTLGMSNPI